MNKIYQKVQEKILEKLDQGIVPWRKSWNTPGGSPKNLISMKDYNGYNHLYLSCSCQPTAYWLTFRQAKKLGGYIKAGEKGSPIVYYQIKKKIDENGKEKTYPIMRGYTVFNIAQCEGIENPDTNIKTNDLSPLQQCEEIIEGYKDCPKIIESGNPYYEENRDVIGIPDMKYFMSENGYYSSLFHESVHSTKHKNRLGRDLDRAREELVAEIGASFLCDKTGILAPILDNKVSYIDGWRKKISSDPKLVVQCASIAQKAVNHILGENNGN